MPELLRNAIRLTSGAALLTLFLVATHVTASDPREGAVLRIALRTTAGTMQDCRKLSPAELEALPMHMRRPEVCESRALPYRLEVRVGGRPLLDRTYTASGIRGDRPLTVDEELALSAGTHDVAIRFAPALEPDGADKSTKSPPAFTFDAPVDFTEGRIRVATLDALGAALEIR